MSAINQSSLVFLQEIENKHLLLDLIQQLNKDSQLAGLDVHFDASSTSGKLVKELYDVLVNLMCNDFRNYLNFLYRIDISEQNVKSITETDPEQIAKIVTLLVLKREWQKVTFRNKSQ